MTEQNEQRMTADIVRSEFKTTQCYFWLTHSKKFRDYLAGHIFGVDMRSENLDLASVFAVIQWAGFTRSDFEVWDEDNLGDEEPEFQGTWVPFSNDSHDLDDYMKSRFRFVWDKNDLTFECLSKTVNNLLGFKVTITPKG